MSKLGHVDELWPKPKTWLTQKATTIDMWPKRWTGSIRASFLLRFCRYSPSWHILWSFLDYYSNVWFPLCVLTLFSFKGQMKVRRYLKRNFISIQMPSIWDSELATRPAFYVGFVFASEHIKILQSDTKIYEKRTSNKLWLSDLPHASFFGGSFLEITRCHLGGFGPNFGEIIPTSLG